MLLQASSVSKWMPCMIFVKYSSASSMCARDSSLIGRKKWMASFTCALQCFLAHCRYLIQRQALVKLHVIDFMRHILTRARLIRARMVRSSKKPSTMALITFFMMTMIKYYKRLTSPSTIALNWNVMFKTRVKQRKKNLKHKPWMSCEHACKPNEPLRKS